MTTPKRIQLRRTKGWRKPPNAVVVSRPTKWGNPANWKKYSYLTELDAKAMATEWYREWIMGDMVGQYYPEQRQWILDHIHELAGKDLACWCKPGESCHADVLLKLANATSAKND